MQALGDARQPFLPQPSAGAESAGYRGRRGAASAGAVATPADVFDVLRETLNAVRLGRIVPAQAYAVGYVANSC